jgi:hypothetical protein
MILQLVTDTFIVFVVCLTALLAGLRIFRLVNHSSSNRFFLSVTEQLLFSLSLGFSVISYYTLCLTLVNRVYAGWFAGFVLTVFVLCYKEIGFLAGQLKKIGRVVNDVLSPITPVNVILLLFLAIAVISNFFYNYCPPNQVREMMYDLSVPKFFVKHFTIEPGLINYYSYHYFYYLHFQMLYTMCMSLNESGLSFKLFNYAFGLINLVLVYVFAKRFINKKVALLSTVIFYLIPLNISITGCANVEFGLVFYGVLALWAVFNWAENNEDRWLWLSAVMAGTAFAVKLPGFAAVVSVGLFVFIRLLIKMKCTVKQAAIKTVVFGFVCFIVVAPWIFRNYLLTGNPAYPFSVAGLQGSAELGYERDEFRAQAAYHGIKHYLKMNHGILVVDIDQSPGPVIITFLLAGFLLAARFNKTEKKILLFSVLSFVTLYFLLPLPFLRFEFRYYLFSYGLFAIVAAVTIEKLRDVSVLLSKTVNVVVILSLLFPCLFMSVYFGMKRIPLFLGKEQPDVYINSRVPEYETAVIARYKLPADARIVCDYSVVYSQYYWLQRTYKMPIEYMKLNDSAELVAKLRTDGMTHLFLYYNPGEKDYGRFNRYYYRNLKKYCDKTTVLEYGKNDYYLYRI